MSKSHTFIPGFKKKWYRLEKKRTSLPAAQKAFHVLFCPLNWGLGHASRMIPLIYEFRRRNCKITIGASGPSMQMMQEEFPEGIRFVNFPGYQVNYSQKNSQLLKIAGQIPSIVYHTMLEKSETEKLFDELQPDLIISDNRYRVRSERVYSVFVTHQLHILLPSKVKWMGKWLNKLSKSLIKKFDLCLVPDNEQFPGLSGYLSHGTGLENIIFTGPLSRFGVESSGGIGGNDLPENFIVVILSGPEPQRTILEKLLAVELKDEHCIWFRGLPGSSNSWKKDDHWFYDHAPNEFMRSCIQKSRLVICRSGYSSVMDMAVLSKKTVMVPTPGQPEQEYLAEHLDMCNLTISCKQEDLHKIKDCIRKADLSQGFPTWNPDHNLEKIVDGIIQKATEKKSSHS